MRGRQHHRVLALYPCARGVGFALMDHERRLVDWGTRGVRGSRKNAQSLAAITALITHHRPTRIVLEDSDANGSRRHARIRILHVVIRELARDRRAHVRYFTRQEVFAYYGVRTKHELALVVARALPALRPRVPPRRKAWMSEDARQSLFDAAALALMCAVHPERGRRHHRSPKAG